MTQPTLIVEADDGTTKTTIDCDSAQATDPRGEMSRAQATVPRADWTSTSVDARTDRLYIDRPDGTRLFGGRYDDDERTADSVTVTIASFERDAIDVEPTGGNLVLSNVADSTVINNRLIGAVPTLSAGTVDTLASALSWSFPNASRAKLGRKVQVATGAALQYNADRTVDYVTRLGSDRTLTISPANQNVVGEPSVTRDVRDEVTHIRAFGAGDGTTQRQAEAVTSGYSGGREVWREFEDTDIKELDRLQQIADRLASEYDGEPRKTVVEATLVGVDVQRGDVLPVEIPDRGIDRDLQVVQLVERFGPDGQTLEATLTNRVVDRDAEGNPREDLQRFNRGYQGFVDREQAGGAARQPVTPSLNAQTSVIYPDDVIQEQEARVLVEGLPYRAYSAGATNNPVFGLNSKTAVTGGYTTVPDGSWTTIANIDPAGGADSQMFHGAAYIEDFTTAISGATNLKARLSFNFGYEGYWPQQSGMEVMAVGRGVTQDIGTISWSLAGDFWNLAQIELQVRQNIGTSEAAEVVSEMFLRFDNVHTHPPDPGVVESFGDNNTVYYPSNCDVLVNGTSMGTSIGSGSGTFSQFVDIAGQLSAGDNTVEVTSDTLGHVRATVQTELFRQGPTSN